MNIRASGVLVSLVVVAATAGPASAATVDPIVGFWNLSGGVVNVAGSGSSFAGLVVKATRFSTCTHPSGEAMWQITKTATGYTGTHVWFKALGDCRPGNRARPPVATIAGIRAVSFADACNLHDTGYSGAIVVDKIRGGIKDFRTWTRKQVDAKFHADMRFLCRQQIPAAYPPP